MKKLFKKKNRIIFEFRPVENGFFLDVKTEGDIKDDYVLGLKDFVDRALEKDKNGKDKRK